MNAPNATESGNKKNNQGKKREGSNFICPLLNF